MTREIQWILRCRGRTNDNGIQTLVTRAPRRRYAQARGVSQERRERPPSRQDRSPPGRDRCRSPSSLPQPGYARELPDQTQANNPDPLTQPHIGLTSAVKGDGSNRRVSRVARSTSGGTRATRFFGTATTVA